MGSDDVKYTHQLISLKEELGLSAQQDEDVRNIFKQMQTKFEAMNLRADLLRSKGNPRAFTDELRQLYQETAPSETKLNSDTFRLHMEAAAQKHFPAELSQLGHEYSRLLDELFGGIQPLLSQGQAGKLEKLRSAWGR